MMSFIMKKKKYKFQVDFSLKELSAVPFVNGMLFAKLRLLDGGSFSNVSTREEVKDHCVRWDSNFSFSCKMSANVSTGILDPCSCRISVRKEVKGGRSFQKLGFVDLNLAEFAGAGVTTRCFLLEGYDAKHRQDNSVIKVTLEMTLLSGDPCFKAPSYAKPLLASEKTDEQVQLVQGLKKGDDQSGGSVASVSSGFGSLPRKQRPSVLSSEFVVSGPEVPESLAEDHANAEFELGHSRNSSYASQQSKASGYSSMHSHSRQNSGESGHMRNPSSVSTYSDMGLPGQNKTAERKRPLGKKVITEENRMDSTRVNADKLIAELIESTNLDEAEETSGLRLYINKDGTTVLGSHEVRGKYEHMVFNCKD